MYVTCHALLMWSKQSTPGSDVPLAIFSKDEALDVDSRVSSLYIWDLSLPTFRRRKEYEAQFGREALERMIAAAADDRGPAHLSQLLDGDLSIPITVKQGEGLLEAVDVAGGDLPVRADPEGGGPGHNSSSAGGKPSTGQVGASGAADQPLLAAFHSSCDRPCNAPSQLNSTHGGYLYLELDLDLTSFQLHI